jgi:hypothetical protein
MEIENGIPIPQPHSAARGGRVYPFLYTLEVGQSVLVETEGLNRISLNACRAYAKRRYGRKFTLRTLPEGTRIWRTA